MGLLRKKSGRTEHAYVEERLSCYRDGQLSPQEHLAVERHLATCQRCRWHLETLEQTIRCMRELPVVAVPRAFSIPVPSQPLHAARRAWGLPVLQGATALVALLFFFAVAGDLILSGGTRHVVPKPQSVSTDAGGPTAAALAAAPESVAVEVTVEVEKALVVATEGVAPAPTAAPAPAEPGAVERVAVATQEEPMAKALSAPAPESEAQGEGAVTGTVAVAAVDVSAAEPETASMAAEAPPAAVPEATATAAELAPTSPPSNSAITAEPTGVANLRQTAQDTAEDERGLAGALQESVRPWLGPAQFVLGVAFVLLASLTIVTLLRRLPRR